MSWNLKKIAGINLLIFGSTYPDLPIESFRIDVGIHEHQRRMAIPPCPCHPVALVFQADSWPCDCQPIEAATSSTACSHGRDPCCGHGPLPRGILRSDSSQRAYPHGPPWRKGGSSFAQPANLSSSCSLARRPR